ncbi:GDSL-type esterase/lipase family protein, partial [bacterium]|nr:GDSL-type esterase/lipase family protein [bacterium]
MKKINLLLIFFLVSACTNSTKVVFLGDSITAAAIYDKEVAEPWGDTFVYPKATGFITLLKENVGDNVKLIGKGISGDKVSDLLTRYKDDVIKLNPDIVFIYIGINDVWHKYDFGTGSDIDFYENGLRKMIVDIKSQGSEIVLCTPTLIGENSGEFTLVNQFKDVETMEKMNGDLDAFSDVIRKLSTEFNTDLLDLR